MPIRLRLVLVVTVAAVVLAVVGVLVGSWGLRVSLVASIDQGLRRASQPIAEAVGRREERGGGGSGSGGGSGRGGGSDDSQRRQESGLEVKDIQERIDATPDTPA